MKTEPGLFGNELASWHAPCARWCWQHRWHFQFLFCRNSGDVAIRRRPLERLRGLRWGFRAKNHALRKSLTNSKKSWSWLRMVETLVIWSHALQVVTIRLRNKQKLSASLPVSFVIWRRTSNAKRQCVSINLLHFQYHRMRIKVAFHMYEASSIHDRCITRRQSVRWGVR